MVCLQWAVTIVFGGSVRGYTSTPPQSPLQFRPPSDSLPPAAVDRSSTCPFDLGGEGDFRGVIQRAGLHCGSVGVAGGPTRPSAAASSEANSPAGSSSAGAIAARRRAIVAMLRAVGGRHIALHLWTPAADRSSVSLLGVPCVVVCSVAYRSPRRIQTKVATVMPSARSRFLGAFR